jgi:hypothetical protein
MVATSTLLKSNDNFVILMETGGISKSDGTMANQCMKTMIY